MCRKAEMECAHMSSQDVTAIIVCCYLRFCSLMSTLY